ncbi:PKD-like family lipoprotein [Pedobacter sp. L105]|uniref:PKD-like family lipoprotein n=1 Tax=Pedobacter sp. L105 TaxID=1641871 RepID=UPI00131B1DB8|nr:PKD-like family lipoprotein [Pedobacter sp. L105]
MKCKPIFICVFFSLFLYACKKDLGNYTYSPPSQPVVANFQDSTFNALVGDSLILKPKVTLAGANPLTDLTFLWAIDVTEEARTATYTGYPLRMLYNLSPKLRTAKLTITDKRNGIKYFIPFNILGNTQFSVGTTVLSVQNGVTKLSFVKPDNTILPDLYFALNGTTLPSNPIQLFPKPLAYQPGTAENYWVICNDPAKSSVVIDGSTMLRKNYFTDQFFSPPTSLVTTYFEAALGYPTGVINDKLYVSITSTAPFAPDFGKFANPQSGNYTLSRYYVHTANFYFGFDNTAKAFISFDSGGNYMGTDYTVSGNAFDPKNIGTGDLIFMQPVSGISYAFFKDATGVLNELSFNLNMDDYNNRAINPLYKRVFAGASLVQPDTKWQQSVVDVFYFTSNDKIYRYNPLNQDLKPLDANFGGKKVTMIKLSADGKMLTAGVDGALITLDVSVGKNGTVTKTVNGIPGTPIDIFINK